MLRLVRSSHKLNFIIALIQTEVSLLLERVTFFVRAKKVTQKTRPERSCFACPQPSPLPRVVLTRIPARQDSIGLPWPIDPTSEAGFGELTGSHAVPSGDKGPLEACRGIRLW